MIKEMPTQTNEQGSGSELSPEKAELAQLFEETATSLGSQYDDIAHLNGKLELAHPHWEHLVWKEVLGDKEVQDVKVGLVTARDELEMDDPGKILYLDADKIYIDETGHINIKLSKDDQYDLVNSALEDGTIKPTHRGESDDDIRWWDFGSPLVAKQEGKALSLFAPLSKLKSIQL